MLGDLSNWRPWDDSLHRLSVNPSPDFDTYSMHNFDRQIFTYRCLLLTVGGGQFVYVRHWMAPKSNYPQICPLV